MFCFGKSENESVLWKVEVLSKKHGGEPSLDSMATRRRGSLPLDFLLATHSGDFCHFLTRRDKFIQLNGKRIE